ncbi:MAG: hypothetical protein PUB87_06550 [Eubacteriaceae bacterium]|nr:hypothetical protein [Eubacteriaceae bacterium]
MHSRKIKALIAIILIILCGLIALLFIRENEQSELRNELNSLEFIYNGCYDTEEDSVSTMNGRNDTEINICFHDENIGYDEKNIMKSNPENKMIRGFNSYYIKYPTKDLVNETVWYLCRNDTENGLLLLNEENEVIGRIYYTLDKGSLFKGYSISYFWQMGDEIIPIYKCSDAYYSFGKAYLRSRYYSGYIPE